MTDVDRFKIVAIQEPTEESEARLRELREKDQLTDPERSEELSLMMRHLWNCEC